MPQSKPHLRTEADFTLLIFGSNACWIGADPYALLFSAYSFARVMEYVTDRIVFHQGSQRERWTIRPTFIE